MNVVSPEPCLAEAEANLGFVLFCCLVCFTDFGLFASVWEATYLHIFPLCLQMPAAPVGLEEERRRMRVLHLYSCLYWSWLSSSLPFLNPPPPAPSLQREMQSIEMRGCSAWSLWATFESNTVSKPLVRGLPYVSIRKGACCQSLKNLNSIPSGSTWWKERMEFWKLSSALHTHHPLYI